MVLQVAGGGGMSVSTSLFDVSLLVCNIFFYFRVTVSLAVVISNDLLVGDGYYHVEMGKEEMNYYITPKLW